VLVRHRWNASPRFVPRGPDPDLSNLEADAALLIGDPALVARWDGPPPVDLGQEWADWTGLPFVFAVWVARTPQIALEVLGPLQRAADRGRRHLTQIARAGAASLGLSTSVAERYLHENLSFHFGDDERQGLERFRELWSSLA
jgi:chorismate dehydratase